MSQMCKVLEEMCREEREEGRKEGRQEGRQEEITHLPLEEVKRLQRGQEQTD